MPSATLLLLTSSPARNLKILCHLLTTVMSAHFFNFFLFKRLLLILKHEHVISLQVPHVNRTEYQLIDISEDGFVSWILL